MSAMDRQVLHRDHLGDRCIDLTNEGSKGVHGVILDGTETLLQGARKEKRAKVFRFILEKFPEPILREMVSSKPSEYVSGHETGYAQGNVQPVGRDEESQRNHAVPGDTELAGLGRGSGRGVVREVSNMARVSAARLYGSSVQTPAFRWVSPGK